MRWALVPALLLWAGAAHAQIGLPAGQAQLFPQVGGGGGYSGPGDVVSGALLWGGLRAYSSADRGTHVANVCDNTGGVDVNCADVASDATTGIPPNFPTIVGVTCTNGGSHPCSVKTLYNKGSLTGDWTAASISSRPTWTGSVIGSLPAMTCPGSGSFTTSSSIASQSQPYTFSAVAKRTSGTAASSGITGTDSNTSLFFNSSAQAALYVGGTITVSAADSAFHAIQGVGNNTSSTISADGTTTTGTTGSSASGAGAIPLCADLFGNQLNGIIGEAGFWGVGFNSTQISSMNSNQHNYWGF